MTRIRLTLLLHLLSFSLLDSVDGHRGEEDVRHLHVLVVDDSNLNRKMLVKVLNGEREMKESFYPSHFFSSPLFSSLSFSDVHFLFSFSMTLIFQKIQKR